MKYKHLSVGDWVGALKIIESLKESGIGKFKCFCAKCMSIIVVRKDSILRRQDCGCSRMIAGFGVYDKMDESDPAITSIWEGMINRCYGKGCVSYKTYREVSICDEWRSFKNFYEWAKPLYKDGLFLDKDLKSLGNKVYSPETCLFVTREVNNFLTLRKSDRGQYPLGVSWHKRDSVFQGIISINNRRSSKYFDSAEEAHKFWQINKAAHAEMLAASEENIDVRDALLRVRDKLLEDIENGVESEF